MLVGNMYLHFDPKKQVNSAFKLEYARIKMDTGLSVNESMKLAEEMIQDLEKLK